jgi:uncharacterized heparinase superfamily protein
MKSIKGLKLLLRPVLDRFAWYRARLLAMDAAEIAHRLVEVAAKQASRRLSRGWEAIESVGSLAMIPAVASRVCALPPNISAIVAREADSVRAGSFHLLGARWPETVMPVGPGFWRIDPDDGQPFPHWDAFTFDISFRHGIGTREIKRIWELNRLQFLVPLAADAALRKDQQSTLLAIDLIRSWMAGNPPFRGLAWISSIELALRIISVALTLSIVGIERLDAATRGAALRFFFAHIDWIRRFPSLYSSANNHRIAELAGLVIGSTMAPGFPGAAGLRENSWRAMLVEIDQQICPNGAGAEQSPGYTAFSIELFLLAATALGRESKLPAATMDRLLAWAEQSLWLMDAEARVPAIGDFDDCRVIATTQAPEPRYVASLVAAVSACVGRPDLAPPAKDPNIRDAILGSSNVSPAQPAGLRSFASGGYSVIRSKDKAPIILTLDHGPLGYLSIAAHGHADTLAIWLSIGNQPVIVDAGTYLYHSNKDLRDLFRHTAVHNTLTLEGIGSSRPSGPFNWATKAKARLVSSESATVSRIVAEHDGYSAQHGLIHRRTVEFDGASRFTIIDELLGASPDKGVAVSFLIDPSCRSSVDRGEVLITNNEGQVARIASTGPLRARIVHGDEKTGLGWLSPSFGVRVPTDQILFEGHLDKPSTITITVL